jgi:hypothetical protein
MDGDLCGEVMEQRVARLGEGRSKGLRAIILFRRGEKASFVYCFSESRRANIDVDEER